ncbi:MAG: DegT/DnrJ/EryC1/StrS family aminotransferase [Bdellovibrionales bacterium]|nr:DegT/DnrJ/EryC1/StrS family aminotransferase [Bdellovibrionales bacterium]
MIPLFSPLRQNEPYFAEFQRQFEQVLRSGHYILGPQVTSFETSLAESLGYRFAVGCSSGTEALILSLKALGLSPGAQVLTPAYSFVASASSILWAGLRPVLVDVCPETGCVTAERVEAAITPATEAVIAVDLYGRQNDLAAIRELCRRRSLRLIEDGAQSIGVPNAGAELYTLSFYPTKNIGAVGDAGAILTDDETLAGTLTHLTQHGATARDQFERVGTNGRLDTLQAALLGLKIPHVHTWSEDRRRLAHRYREALAPLEAQGKLKLPPLSHSESENVWSLFTLRIPENRNGLMEALQGRGVGCGIYYLKSLNQQAALHPHLNGGKFPNAERLSQTVLSIPIYPELAPVEQQKVVDSLMECLSGSI